MKKCHVCNKEHNLSRTTKCTECKREYDRIFYSNPVNLAKRKAQQARAAKKRRMNCQQLYVKYLRKHPCMDCGEDNILVLEADHTSGTKKNNICSLIQQNNSWLVIEKELKKCEIVCANCHKIRTHNRLPQGSYRSKL